MMILNPTVEAALAQDEKRGLLMCHIEWPSGEVYTHSRVGEKRWDNRTWIGVGEFANIGTVESGVKTGRLSLQLRVNDEALLNEAIQDDAVGSAVRLYLGVMNEKRRITAVQLIHYGFVAATPVSYEPVPVISIEVAGHRERRNRPRENLRFSANAWRHRHPGDSYCDDVEALSKGPLNGYSGSNAVGRGGRLNGGGGREQIP
ncbi:hypothetical protein [Bowmanella dokdonensis]|uniref:Uncharacterized protein n=1 Tax=Bowmanella dokdonensis TaxID=751969 RepID=A0A939DLK1_9ALTE|nr:hypothetical protein [Bowmanella dokdonensis]MBN7824784.1 hypothetical protein [Bowmanella dokdonensis]